MTLEEAHAALKALPWGDYELEWMNKPESLGWWWYWYECAGVRGAWEGETASFVEAVESLVRCEREDAESWLPSKVDTTKATTDHSEHPAFVFWDRLRADYAGNLAAIYEDFNEPYGHREPWYARLWSWVRRLWETPA